ncbi:MAG TPA: replication initiator protein A [Cytophagaceae bacterium]|jgi:plasmid replication initiation protein|nr:replication initiator protein A [Cytophagaceae bacterium]
MEEAKKTNICVYGYGDTQLQDEQDAMSYPFYVLSKTKSLKIRIFYGVDSEGVPFSIEMSPNQKHGSLTIFDYDIVLFSQSLISQALRDGLTPSKTIRITKHRLLKAIGRHTGGDNYKDLDASFARIQGTMFRNTKLKNIKGKRNGYEQYYLISSLVYIPETEEYEYQICDWIYDSIMDKQLLSLSPDYFKIKSPINRRLYLMFRKHAGKQDNGYWISFEALFKKSGSEDVERKFKYSVVNFIKKKNNLPEYHLTIEFNECGLEGVRGIRRDKLPEDDLFYQEITKRREKISG